MYSLLINGKLTTALCEEHCIVILFKLCDCNVVNFRLEGLYHIQKLE